MLRLLRTRRRQGHRTMRYPDGPPPPLPERFRGVPRIAPGACPEDCRACAEFCPTNAIEVAAGAVRIDLGRCLFCPECEQSCPSGAITFTNDHRLAARRREDLLLGPEGRQRAAALDEALRRLFRRSLRLRVVSAGGCNACEADTNVLTTIGWDLGRFGIQYVASPRHADGLIILGPVTANMRLALEKTYAAVPEPRIVIAIGACAISGGPYAGRPEQHDGADSVVKVDLYIPGCPPHPLTILDGLLGLIGRLGKEPGRSR